MFPKRNVILGKLDLNYLLLLQNFLVLQKKMKIQSLVPKNSKIRLRLQNNHCTQMDSLKNSHPQKSFLAFNIDVNSKQNDEKTASSLQKRVKCTTFTELPQNRKNSQRRSISSLNKKANGEIRQFPTDLTLSRHIKLVNRALQGRPEHRKALQIYQSLLIKRVIIEKQARQSYLQKKDLLMIFALMFNPELNCLENKRLSFLASLVSEGYNQAPNCRLIQNNNKIERAQPQLCSSTIKVMLSPKQKKVKSLKIESKVIQASVVEPWMNNQSEKNPLKKQQLQHHTQIKRLRQSLLSQQTLVTNIKNGKHSSTILHTIPQGIQKRFSENIGQTVQNLFMNQTSNTLSYVSEQNELLMRVASQQFKKYQSEIYEYGLLMQSKHLEVDMQYEDFVTNYTLNQDRQLFKGIIKTLTLDYSKTDFQKYERLTDSFQQFYQKIRSKDVKLRCLIEKKSTLITDFSSKMESWIESLSIKKQFINNLRNYIVRQKEHIHNTMQYLTVILSPSQLSLPSNQLININQHLQLLRKSLQSFIQSIINAYDFS